MFVFLHNRLFLIGYLQPLIYNHLFTTADLLYNQLLSTAYLQPLMYVQQLIYNRLCSDM
jgi:hypothetical protein